MFSRKSTVIGHPRRRAFLLRSSAGFTLIELIVVLVLVGILAATVSMKSGWLTSGTNLRMATDQVVGDLRFLQSRMMATMAYTGGTYTNTASFPVGATFYYVGGQLKYLPPGVTIGNALTLTVTYDSLGEYLNQAGGPNVGVVLNSQGLTSSITIYGQTGNVDSGAY